MFNEPNRSCKAQNGVFVNQKYWDLVQREKTKYPLFRKSIEVVASCVVCLEDNIVINDMYKQPHCNHGLHGICLNCVETYRQFKHIPTCPLCRASLDITRADEIGL